MEPAQSQAFSEPLLAAMPQLREKPHLGVPSSNPALHLGHEVCNSTTALGLQAALHLERVQSRSTGKERDTESGNDYFDARYYSSAMGRFMSPDWAAQEEPVPYAQLDDPQSLNLYAYVRNNPLTRVDADGHDGCCDFSIPVAEGGVMPPIPDYRHPITPYSDEYTLTQEKVGAALDQLGYDLTHVPVLQSLKESVIGWFSKKDSDGTVPKADRDPKRRFTPEESDELKEKAEGKCTTCGQKTTPPTPYTRGSKHPSTEGQAGHKKSWAKGGRTTVENGKHQCKGCNTKEGKNSQ